MSRESKTSKDEIQRNRNEAYQGGWSDGDAEGYGKASADLEAAVKRALEWAAVQADALESKWWGEYKDRMSPNCADPHYQGASDGAGDVAIAIRAASPDTIAKIARGDKL